MSSEHNPRINEDLALWEAELPSEVCTGYPEETNPLDALLRTELDEADRYMLRLHQKLESLDMLIADEVHHSYGTPDGYVRIASAQVPTSYSYHRDRCIHLVINAQSNDIFSSELRKHVAIEDYFLDFEKNRMTVQKGWVTFEGSFELPEKTPTVIRPLSGGGGELRWGEGYTLRAPDYDSTLDITDAYRLRTTAGKLLQLISGLSEATLDCKK